MWVKICANTNVEDALVAAEAGADAVGFVFADSVRKVTPADVREITSALPAGMERVGVFAKHSAEEILRAVELAGLTAAQLHGGLDLRLAEKLRARSIEVIHTLHWAVGEDASSPSAGFSSDQRVAAGLATLRQFEAGARVLVDAKVGMASGGLGVAFDWAAAAKVLRASAGLRVVVAGGLRPESVAEAVRVLAPWGVDVASGVEARPGKKDAEKVRAFVEKARRA